MYLKNLWKIEYSFKDLFEVPKGKRLDRNAELYGLKRKYYFYGWFKESDKKFRKRILKEIKQILIRDYRF